MPYIATKVYSDGGHYIAIPSENFPSRKRKRQKPIQTKMRIDEKPIPTPKDRFETVYSESLKLPKKERKAYITEKLKDEFETAEKANGFVENNIKRKEMNTIKRRIRLKGNFIGGIINYGWSLTTVYTEADGGKVKSTKKVVINEEEAAIVKEIFTEYANGKKAVDIARELNERGILNRG